MATRVRAMDVTDVPMARGLVCLVAVVDWFSRRVPAWRLSITMHADLGIEALKSRRPASTNPRSSTPIPPRPAGRFSSGDRIEGLLAVAGSQFTSIDFTKVLLTETIQISMDGKGAGCDNGVVERLWRSIEYEAIYRRADDTVCEARASIGRYPDFYNGRRPHSRPGRQAPDQAYFDQPLRAAA